MGTKCFLDQTRTCDKSCVAFDEYRNDTGDGECSILAFADKLVRHASTVSKVLLQQDADRIRNSGPRPPVVK